MSDWQESVRDDKHGGAVNRISYEWCVLTTLREKVRCTEVWVKGAHRFRNPDEDLPEDFALRRDEYYVALEQPREARVFCGELAPQGGGDAHRLRHQFAHHYTKVKIVTTKKDKGRIFLTPLAEQTRATTTLWG